METVKVLIGDAEKELLSEIESSAQSGRVGFHVVDTGNGRE